MATEILYCRHLCRLGRLRSEWDQEREGGEASLDSEDVSERVRGPSKRGVEASAIEGNMLRKEESPLGCKRGEMKYNVVIGHHVGVSAGPCTSIIVAGHKRAVNLLRGNENEEVKDGAFDTAEIVALDFELRAVLELVLLFRPVRFVTDRFVPNPRTRA